MQWYNTNILDLNINLKIDIVIKENEMNKLIYNGQRKMRCRKYINRRVRSSQFPLGC